VAKTWSTLCRVEGLGVEASADPLQQLRVPLMLGGYEQAAKAGKLHATIC
jgi:hypothetical protein